MRVGGLDLGLLSRGNRKQKTKDREVSSNPAIFSRLRFSLHGVLFSSWCFFKREGREENARSGAGWLFRDHTAIVRR